MRRIFWFALGMGLGLGAAYLLARGARRVRARVPQAIREEARATFESLRSAVSDALDEGRRVMHQTEDDLRRADAWRESRAGRAREWERDRRG